MKPVAEITLNSGEYVILKVKYEESGEKKEQEYKITAREYGHIHIKGEI